VELEFKQDLVLFFNLINNNLIKYEYMKNLNLIIIVIGLSLMMWSCEGNTSSNETNANEEVSTEASSDGLSGVYICTKHFSEGMVGDLSITFIDDVNAKLNKMAATYVVNGDSVMIKGKYFDLNLKIDGNTIGNNDVVYTKE